MGCEGSGFGNDKESSHDMTGEISRSCLRIGSPSERTSIVEPHPPLVDPYRATRRNGFHPGDSGPNPGRFKGESLKILTENPPSTLTDEDLDKLKELYSIPEDFDLNPPYGKQRVDWKVPGETFLYEIAFQIGLRFPLPPFIRKVLSLYQVAPCQLMPNVWRLLLGLQALSEIQGIDSVFEAFRYTYYFSGRSSEEGRVIIGIKPGKDPLVLTSNKFDNVSWKKRYFLVKEHYLFGPGGAGGVPLHWRKIGSLDSKFPSQLSDLAVNQVEQILQVPEKKRHLDTLLSSKSLAQTSIWADCIAASGSSPAAFVERFENMDEVKNCAIPNFSDFREMPASLRGKSRTAAAGTSTVSANLPPSASAITSKKRKSVEYVESSDECEKFCLGEGVALSLDSTSFKVQGDFDLVDNIDHIREGGLSMTAGHAISQAVKGLQAAIALNEDIGSLERKYKDMESFVDGLKKEVASLTDSEKRAADQLKEVQDLLKKERERSLRVFVTA